MRELFSYTGLNSREHSSRDNRCLGHISQQGKPIVRKMLVQAAWTAINALMLQQLLAESHWAGRFTTRDLAVLTLLIWEHVNPYGGFDLNMSSRIPLR